MDNKRDGLINRVINALLGREDRRDKKDGENLSLKSKIGSLELDLKEKAEEIAAIKREYEILRNSQKQAVDAAAQNALERVYKDLVNPASQLLAMKRFVESGRELAPGDIFKAADQIVAGLEGQGLKMIGGTGDMVCFDSSIHQPSGNGVLKEGDAVQIRFAGFRFGEKVLKKAMVSAIKK